MYFCCGKTLETADVGQTLADRYLNVSAVATPAACPSTRFSVFDRDALHLGEEVVGILGALPAQPRVLHPAKGQVQIPHHPAVGPHKAWLYPLSHPMDPAHIPGPDNSAQSVAHAVGLGDGLVLCVEGDDAGDGAEDLLLHDPGAVGHASDDGGQHEEAPGVTRRQVQLVHALATVDGSAFAFGKRHIAANLFQGSSETDDKQWVKKDFLIFGFVYIFFLGDWSSGGKAGCFNDWKVGGSNPTPL